MAMKVTPPEANVINTVDVIEHILGKGGLIEQNKNVLFKPILFNEITLDVLFQYREWFFAFVPTYEYLLTLKNPRNFYLFPDKQQIVFNSTSLDCQKENFLVSYTKNYDKVVLDYGLRPEQLNQKYLESEITLFEDTDKLIMDLKKQNKKDLFVFLYNIMEHIWWAVNVIWAFRDLIKEEYPIATMPNGSCFGTHVTDLTYYSTNELKLYEAISMKDKFARNLLPVTRISRDMEKCIYYHGFNEHGDTFNSTPDIPNDENCGDDY